MRVTKLDTLPSQNRNFKKGLTSYEIRAVKNLTSFERKLLIEKINNYWGINIKQTLPDTVLKCVDWTAQIMHRAGFELPKNFRFGPACKDRPLGTYAPLSDLVTINSDHKEFYDIELQNKLEERQGSFHPDTKHFLSTYLHEFSHAAHYKNLCKKLGQPEGYNAFMGYLSNYSPTEVIVGPINSMIKSIYSIFPKNIIEKVFPPENGIYSYKDLTEYIAEYNARELALFLGDKFEIDNVPKDFASTYKGYPANWNIEELKEKLQSYKLSRACAHLHNLMAPGLGFLVRAQINYKIAELFKEDIQHFNGEIWNGNIDEIKAKSLAFSNEGTFSNT